MSRRLQCFTLALSLCAGARAASISTTLTVTNASLGVGASLTISGAATLTGGIGNGTLSAPALAASASGFSGPFTITLTAGGTITGTLTIPAAMLSGAGTASATVTGGTGTYAGATGSFPSMPGTGGLSGTSFALSFSGAGTITTGGAVGPPPPAPPIVTAVLDAAGNTANLAQGGFFIVKGTNLCPTGPNRIYNIPRPTVGTDGVKVTFTPVAGGSGTDAILYYEVNPSGTSQLSGIVPSTLPVGNYNLTVTNGTVSAPFLTQVMQTKFSLFTQDGSGTGLGVVQNYISATQYDVNRFTTAVINGETVSPLHPGQYLVAWGTGLGPLVGGDNAAFPSYDFSTHGETVLAVVGGMNIPVGYAGRNGYAGEDQINFALPNNVPTGCAISLQISVNGTLSNPSFIAIAPSTGAAACSQPGFTATQLQNLDQGGTYNVGGFSLLQVQETVPTYGTVKVNSASGAFTRYTGFQLSGAAQYASTTSGACTVTHTVTGNTVTATVSNTALDAGTVTLTGPSGSNLSNAAFTEGAAPLYGYSIQLASSGLPAGFGGGTGTIVAGQYTIAGAGGQDVGKFSTSITLGSPLTLGGGGLPATVVRSAGLPLSWTGGNSSDLVEIIGNSNTTTGTGANAVTDAWAFICTTTAGTGGFTVPSSVLTQMPAITAANGGFLEVASSVTPTSFTAPLTAGGNLDIGTFSSFLGYGAQVTYQ